VLPTLPRWTDLDDLHRLLSELDAPDPAPHLVAFLGDDLLFTLRLRPFAPGAYQGPLIEAMALALPLGADRVSVGMPARVWSMDDPVPPVTADVDLRQRVVVQTSVDGRDRDEPSLTMALHPFTVGTSEDPDALAWHPAVDPGPGEGWIPEALCTLVAGRHDVSPGTGEERRRQAERLDRLGHLVVLTDAGRGRMAE
jgi:hypothetical protein